MRVDVKRKTHRDVQLGGHEHGGLLLSVHRPQGLSHLGSLALPKKFIEHLRIDKLTSSFEHVFHTNQFTQQMRIITLLVI